MLSALHVVVLFPILSAVLVNPGTPSCTDGHMGVFPVLVIVSAAAVSVHIQVSL